MTKEIAIHSASERDEVAREAEMLSLVSHPNVIHFERLHRVGAKMAIVMEYADDGDVESKVRVCMCRAGAIALNIWLVALEEATAVE